MDSPSWDFAERWMEYVLPPRENSSSGSVDSAAESETESRSVETSVTTPRPSRGRTRTGSSSHSGRGVPSGPAEFVSKVTRGNGSKSKQWFFTWNNYPADAEEIIREQWHKWNECVVGKEVAPSTGTPHLQGCVAFATALSKRSVKEMPPHSSRAGINSLEWQRVRSWAKSRSYCRKDKDMLIDEVVQASGPQRPGRPKRARSSVDEALWRRAAEGQPSELAQALLEADPEMAVMDASRIKTGIATVPLLLGMGTTKRPLPICIWVYGPGDSGKTSFVRRWVRENAESSTFMVSPPRGINTGAWWDGYHPGRHKVVVLDDLRPSTLAMADFLTLCSSLPRTVEVKGR